MNLSQMNKKITRIDKMGKNLHLINANKIHLIQPYSVDKGQQEIVKQLSRIVTQNEHHTSAKIRCLSRKTVKLGTEKMNSLLITMHQETITETKNLIRGAGFFILDSERKRKKSAEKEKETWRKKIS